MTRHEHADIIHAWADGAEIQRRENSCVAWTDTHNPQWIAGVEYRIKPRTVKHEGWVNIYRMHGVIRIECGCVVYKTKQEAISCAGMHAIATVKIEWEEEE